MLRLIVKGDKERAELAAMARCIPTTTVAVHGREQTGYTTTLETHKAFERNVAEWFGEPGEAPYPDGTCLHYSTGEGR